MPNPKERNLIFICFSRNDCRPPLDFRKIFEDQLNGVNLAKRGGLKLEFFVDEKIRPGTDWQEEIRNALSRTKVAMILEGPGLMTSKFVQEVEIPQFLEDAQRDGVVIFRIPLRHVSKHLIPEELERLQAAHPIDTPLGALTVARRDVAISTILEKLLDAYQGCGPVPLDELDSPPFDVAENERAIQLYPDRILDWIHDSGFENEHVKLDPSFRLELESWAKNGECLRPLWRQVPKPSLLLKEFSKLNNFVDVRKNEKNEITRPQLDGLEYQSARAYPRFRDAQLALYMCKNRSQNHQSDNLKHAKSIMLSLFRKHDKFWDAVTKLDGPLAKLNATEADDPDTRAVLSDFFRACRYVPVCELGIICRLDKACGKHHPNSMAKCYQLLDRICHWSQMANRLMNIVIEKNKVVSVPVAAGDE